MTPRHTELAKIHIAKASLGMPEEAYRSLLDRETGKRSAADLSSPERARVIARFRKLGWRPRPSATTAQRRKIAEMLRADGRPAEYAEAIARRMFSRSIGRLNPEQLRSVIAALTYDRRRREQRTSGAR